MTPVGDRRYLNRMRLVATVSFSRRNLPHWEVANGRYFVTVRCAGSLPRAVFKQLTEIQSALRSADARSVQYARWQRRHFMTLEKYLDAHHGNCTLLQVPAARILVDELGALSEWNVAVPHYTVLPNHWHAMIVPGAGCKYSLATIMKRIKGRSAHTIRNELGGRGAVWQSEWFDRWMRNDTEWEKCVDYIRNNPVKSGLVRTWAEHPWTR